MIDIAYRTYFLNFSQVLSLTIFSLVVPFVIGFDEYGFYVSLFAVPGIASAIVETFLIVEKDSRLVFFYLYFFLLLVVLLLCSLFFSFNEGFVAVIIYFVLVVKAYSYSIINKYRDRAFFEFLLYSETVVVLSYISVAMIFFGVDWKTYRMPVTMLCISSLLYSIAVYLLDKKRENYFFARLRECGGKVGGNNQFSFFRYAFLRVYEDFHFTLLPMMIGSFVSMSASGEYKLSMSVVKLCIKFYPVRYETITMAKKGRLSSYITFSALTVIVSSSIALLLYLISDSDLINILVEYEFNITFFLFSSFPFFGFLLASLPHQYSKRSKLVILSSLLCCMLVTLVLLFLYDYFIWSVIVTSGLLFLLSSYDFFNRWSSLRNG